MHLFKHHTASRMCSINTPTRRLLLTNLFSKRQLQPSKSIRHVEQRVIGYSPKQMFDVVSNVNQYKLFLPHVKNSKILKYKKIPPNDDPPGINNYHPSAYFSAELEVGFPPFLEKYVSDIIVREGAYVRANAQNSKLFTHLGNIWEFKPGPIPNSCILTFHVDFGFASKWYQKVADMFFNLLVGSMTDAFENRCKELYGPPSLPTEKIMANTSHV